MLQKETYLTFGMPRTAAAHIGSNKHHYHLYFRRPKKFSSWMITSEIKNAYKIKQVSLNLCNASNAKSLMCNL